MARGFASSSNQYLSHGAAPVLPYPVSMAVRVFRTSSGGTRRAMSLHHVGSSNRMTLGVDASDNVTMQTAAATITGGTAALGAWVSVVGVWRANNDRSLWVDGVETASTALVSLTIAPDELLLGANRSNAGALQQFWQGRLAEAAVWDTGLTANDVAMLKAGLSPLFVRTDRLAGYWPLLGRAAPETDLAGRFELAVQNGATTAEHPRTFGAVSPRPAAPPAVALAEPRLRSLLGVGR